MSLNNFNYNDGLSKYVIPHLGLAIARGQLPNTSYIYKYGKSTAAVANTYQDIWDNNTTYVYFSAATTLGVSSSSANDTSAGTGARTITVYGLDTNYAPISEVVTMNGQSKVTTSASFIRVYRVRVETSGSVETNYGTIYIYDSSDTVSSGVNTTSALRQAIVPAGEGSTRMALYTVPAGKTAYLWRGDASMIANGTRDAEFEFYVKRFGGSWIEADAIYLGSSNTCVGSREYPVPQPVTEKSDIRVAFKSDSTTTEVTASFTLILIDNE